jgi:hypothetical protein
MANRVWIELERGTPEEMNLRANLANNMLARLRGDVGVAIVSEFSVHGGTYHYGDITSGTEELADNGKWFNLDFMGRK